MTAPVERDLAAEESHAEFAGWMAAQGYPSPDDRYDGDEMAGAFAAGMQAERDLAAQQPKPAPADSRCLVTPRRCWLVSGDAATVTLQSVRADEFARVKVKLCALVASLDETAERGGCPAGEFDQGAAHASAVTARQLRTILEDTAMGTIPPSAPADEKEPSGA